MREHAVQTDTAERHARPAPVRVPARPAAFLALAAAVGNRAATAMVARAESGTGGRRTGARRDRGSGRRRPSRRPRLRRRRRDRRAATRRRSEPGSARATACARSGPRSPTSRRPPTPTPTCGASAKRDRDLARDEQVEAAFKVRVEALARSQPPPATRRCRRGDRGARRRRRTRASATREHLDAVRRLQEQADAVKKALRVKNGLLEVPVGWHDPEPSADTRRGVHARRAHGPVRARQASAARRQRGRDGPFRRYDGCSRTSSRSRR